MHNDSQRIVVGLGEVLWDCFGPPDESGNVPAASRRPGGAPANVAFIAGQLGHKGVVCSRVGNDALGDELIAYLRQHGLDTDYVQRDDDHPTGTVTVDTSRGADHPTYVIHEGAAWDYLDFNDAWKSLMQRAGAICFGTLAQRSEASRRTIGQCLSASAQDCLVVYDVNLRQHWFDRVWVERSLQAASVVKLNTDEVLVLDRLLSIGTEEPGDFSAGVCDRFDVRTVCVTRAKKGCLVYEAGEIYDIPGVQVELADAVGAGDAFTAGLIDAKLAGWPADKAARFANRVGALVASRQGAMPDIRDQLAKLRAEFDE